MAMCRQTVQRYGGFPIPAIVVRDAGEALSCGYTRQPLPVTRTVTRTLYVYTDFVTTKNGISDRHARKIYFSPEENIFSSGGKKLHPLWKPVRLHGLHGYTVTRGYVAFACFSPEKSTSFYMQNKYIFILHIE